MQNANTAHGKRFPGCEEQPVIQQVQDGQAYCRCGKCGWGGWFPISV